MEVASISVSFNAGEHNYRVIDVTLEPSVADKTVRLAFITPKGRRFLGSRLKINGLKASYEIPSQLLDGKGKLYVQAVVYDKTEFIAKSRVVSFDVKGSIDEWQYNGSDGAISPEYLEDRLDENSERTLNAERRLDELEKLCFFTETAFDDLLTKTEPAALVTSLKGKIWAVIGDGQTAVNSHKEKIYAEYAAERLGVPYVLNYAAEGVTAAKKSDTDTSAMCETVSELPKNADIITVMCGVSDMKQNIPIGRPGDTSLKTFYGAVDAICVTLLEKYPGKTIVFVTPPEQKKTSVVNELSFSVSNYAEAVRKVCAAYSIPVFDANGAGEICPLREGHKRLYTDDGLYLNTAAHKKLGNGLLNFLLTLSSVERIFADKRKTTHEPVPVTGIRLSAKTLEIDAFATASVLAAVRPFNAENKNVVWSCTDNGLELSPNGNKCAVTGKTSGKHTLVCTTADGGISASCTIMVKEPPVHVFSVKLSETELMLTAGDMSTITAVVTPENAENKNVSWSADSDCVMLVPKGSVCTVTALSPGTASVRCTAADNDVSAFCTVNVVSGSVPVTGIKLSPAACSVRQNETKTLTATVLPDSATNKTVSWLTSNGNVSLTPNGSKCTVTGVSTGSSTVTASTEDGGFTASCNVSVTAAAVPVTGISLDLQSVELSVGETKKLTAALVPYNASNKIIFWTSSNDNVSLTDSSSFDCTVEAISKGTSVVTASSADGAFSASCNVTIT